MNITHEFDGGSINVVNIDERENIQLALVADNNADTRQWFYFTLETQKDQLHRIRFVNAGDCSFSRALREYQVMASYDQQHWFRVETHYDENELVITHIPEQSTISYAYFAPYSYQRHQNIMAQVNESLEGKVTVLGQTSNNKPIDLITFGEESSDKNKVWVIARQHPGETMAQWFVEGLIKRLISNDTLVQQLLEKSVFYIVANMNPDGSVLGNHRTNSVGLDLNRQWENPSKSDCPEVYYVQQEMHDKGVDLFLDIHGDEEIPHSFIMSSSQSCKVSKQAKRFKENFALVNEHFQTAIDYNTFFNKGSNCCGSSGCGGKGVNKASDYVADKFGCLSMVLEMPFNENKNGSNQISNSSVESCLSLGASILEPILDIL